MSSDYCIVCADPLEFCAFGACGHKETCSKCVIRLRMVLKNTKCVVCQQSQPKVFVTRFAGDYTRSLSQADFEHLERSTPKNCCLKQAQAYFDDARHCEELRGLCSFTHPLVGSFSSLKALKQELKRLHKAEFCNICLEGRKVFISEQVTYTKQQLQRHMKHGDDDGPMARAVGFKGHPLCSYCDMRFYGDNEQFEHMTRVHEECFICKRRNPHKHVYYENYGALEEHFKEDHHLCQSQECLEKKFVVFSTEQELKTHVVREHGGTMTKAEKKQALTVETGFILDHRGANGGSSRVNSRSSGPSGSAAGARGGAAGGAPSGRTTNYLSQERRQDVVIIGGDANMPSRNSSRNASSTYLPDLEDRMANAAVSDRQGGLTANRSTNSLRSLSTQSRSSSAANLASETEFPSIAASSGRPAVGGRWAATNAPHHQKNLSGNAAEDFPALGGGSKPSSSRPPKTMASLVGRQGQTRVIHANSEAFPALAPRPAPTRDMSTAPMSSSLRRANESLAQKIKKRIGTSAYQEYKETSAAWTAGNMPTVEFHELVVSLGIANLVPEIAATCTNPRAREELLDAHGNFRFAETASPGSAKNWVPPEVAALSRSTLSAGGGVWNCAVCTLLNSELNKTCEACGSLRTSDARSTSDASEAFPSLGGGSVSAFAPPAGSIGSNGTGKKGKGKKIGLNDFYAAQARPHPQNVWKNPNLKKH